MTKKIARKSILLASFCLAIVGPLKAEIIYTDIVDAALPEDGSPFSINFDGTGAPEFELSVDGSGKPKVIFVADHFFMTVSAAEWDVMKGLDAGTTIDAAGSWDSFGDAYIDPDWGMTPFPSGADTYLGAKFKIGANVHYGWVRVLWDGGILTIKDFAYESTPNASIEAGDTGDGGGGGVGLSEKSVSRFHLYPNPSNTVVNLSNVKGNKIELISLDGKVLYTNSVTTESFTLDVSMFENGTYLVRILDENNNVMIEKLNID